MVDKNFVEQCLKEALLMQGQLIALKDEQEAIVKRVEKAKLWLSKEPGYVKFLQHLQNVLHQKNIGAFSELLSYFVKDVLQKDKEIVFDLYTYHNLPALKIEAVNNGFRENIYEGNGGSIANIVSTGLRLIALSRLNHRKFIVLDEPDCWLKPDHVPLFAKIIGEISAQLNIQTIIISHHHWKYFKDYGRVIELKYDGPHLTTEIIHDTPDNVKPEERNIIEKIVLSRFMSHYETVFELHPHLTCLIGENDIGKSVLATALKAVSYGDSSDSYIMHTHPEARVLIELTGKKQILWQRFLETNQENAKKVKFSYYIDNVSQGPGEYNSQEAPDFVKQELNICTTEDIDVHIGNQKQPVFLISNDTKPQQRAKILSLGKESLIIQKMMENIKTKKRQNKQIEKEGEERFAIIDTQISILDNIDDIVLRVEKLKDDIFIAEKQANTILDMELLIQDWEAASEVASSEMISPVVISDTLYATYELENFITQYEFYSQVAQLDNIITFEEQEQLYPVSEGEELILEIEKTQAISQIDPVETVDLNDVSLHPTQEIERAIDMISYWSDICIIEPIQYDIAVSDLHNIAQLQEYIDQIENLQNKENTLMLQKNTFEAILLESDNEAKELLSAMGDRCPTCQQPVTLEHLKRGHHA
jgi:hypothetical protein